MFDHQQLKVYLRDKMVPFQDANISISNTGFLYGLGVFTGMRGNLNKSTNKLYLFRPRDHYARFYNSCKLFRFTGFTENYSYDRFLEVILNLIRQNNIHEDVYIRISNFSDENKITPKLVDYKDSLSAFLYPLPEYVPTTGMRCKVSSWTRVDDNCIPSRAKTHGSYVNSAFAKTEAIKAGFDEAIFLDRAGHAVEGSAENLFIVVDGVLVTPPVSDNILEGITRKSVMEIAKNEGIPLVERSIDRSELYRADEVFLTGTGAKVCPVIEIDHYQVGAGLVGPVSKKIQDIYFSAIIGEQPKYAPWLVEV